MRKAVINRKTEVDGAGNISVLFDVIKDETTMFCNVEVTGTPANIEDIVRIKAGELKSDYETGQAIQIPLEIPL